MRSAVSNTWRIGALTRPRQDFLIVLSLLFIFSALFFFGLSHFTLTTATAIVLALGLLFVSFIKIEIGFVLVILAMLLSPEVNIPIGAFRPLSLRLEDFLLIPIFLAWLGRLALRSESRALVRTPLDVPILLIVTVNVISTARGVMLGNLSPEMGFFYNLKLIEFYLLYFVVVNSIRTAEQVKFFLIFILITAGIVAIYGLSQVPSSQIWTVHRVSAPFERTPEPTTLGGYFILVLSLVIALSFYLPANASRFWYRLLMVLIIIPFLFTLSRTSYVSGLFMLFALGIISRKKWFLILLVLLLLLSPFLLPSEVLNRITYNFRDPRYFGFADSSLAQRILVYRKAFHYLQASPLIGHGISEGNILDSQYARILIETGLVGISLFLWMLVRAFKCGLRLLRGTTEWWIKGLALGYTAGLIGLSIHSFGAITFYIVRIMEPFWILTGFIAVLYNLMLKKEQDAGLRIKD